MSKSENASLNSINRGGQQQLVSRARSKPALTGQALPEICSREWEYTDVSKDKKGVSACTIEDNDVQASTVCATPSPTAADKRRCTHPQTRIHASSSPSSLQMATSTTAGKKIKMKSWVVQPSNLHCKRNR